MAQQFGTLQVKVERGKLTLQGYKSTPRGQKYISQVVPMAVSEISDPKFKANLATAMEKLYS